MTGTTLMMSAPPNEKGQPPIATEDTEEDVASIPLVSPSARGLAEETSSPFPSRHEGGRSRSNSNTYRMRSFAYAYSHSTRSVSTPEARDTEAGEESDTLNEINPVMRSRASSNASNYRTLLSGGQKLPLRRDNSGPMTVSASMTISSESSTDSLPSSSAITPPAGQRRRRMSSSISLILHKLRQAASQSKQLGTASTDSSLNVSAPSFLHASSAGSLGSPTSPSLSPLHPWSSHADATDSESESDGQKPQRKSSTASQSGNVPADVYHALSQHALFKSSPAIIDVIVKHLHHRHYHMGDEVITEGEVGKSMFFLIRGAVRVTSKDHDHVYAELGPGAFFGEIGVLFDIARTATIIASSPNVWCASLSTTALAHILPDFPSVAETVRLEAEFRLHALKQEWARKGKKIDESLVGHFKMGELREKLTQVPLFQKCPTDFLHLLELHVETRTYPCGTHIVRKGEQGEEMYILQSGTAVVQDAAQSVLARLNAGAFFGETAVMLDVVRTEDVVATSDCQVWVLKRHHVASLSETFPKLAKRLQRTAQHVHELWQLREARLQAFRLAHPQSSDGAAAPDPLLAATSTEILLPAGEREGEEEENALSSSTTSSSSDLSETEAENIAQAYAKKFGPPAPAPTAPTAEAGSSAMVSPTSRKDAFVHTATMKRRASVAVWSDTRLSQLAAAKDAPKAKLSSLSRAFVNSQQPPSTMALGGQQVEEEVAPMPHEVVSLNQLPEQVLCCVFNKLSFLDFWRTRSVCKAFYLAGQSYHCHHTTSMDLSAFSKLMDDHTLEIICSYSGVKLEALSLKHCFQITDAGLSWLSKNCPSLMVLDLHGCWEITSTGVSLLSRACRGLVAIDFSNCRKIDDHAVSALMTHRSSTVTSSQTTLAEGSLIGTTSSLDLASAGGGMESLTFSYCKTLTNASLQLLLKNKSLKRLNLQRCTTINDGGFEGATLCSSLVSVVLSDCSFFTDAAITQLVQIAPNLEHLSLSFCCSLTEVAMEAIAQHCPLLQTLDASFCGNAVSDAALTQLAQQCKQLSRLSLRGCVRITDTGMASLLEHATALKTINISSCKGISSDMIARLKASSWRLLDAQTPLISEQSFLAYHYPSWQSGRQQKRGSKGNHIRRFTSPS